MRQLTTQSRWQPWKGIIFQAAALALLLTAGRLMQEKLGVPGLILSELMFLAMAVVYTLVQKTPVKEVFPFRKPSFKDICGTVMILAGGSMLGYISIYVTMVIMPDKFFEVLSNLNSVIGDGSLLTLFTVSIVAPICEEALERGAVLSHFRAVKKEWVIVLVIGLFFGIMHVDPIRFVNTMIMGSACAYLMVKRDNILLPLLLHFINNTFSGIVSLLSNGKVDTNAAIEQLKKTDPKMTLGSVLMVFFLSPFFVAVAIHLFKDKLPADATPEAKRARSKELSRLYIIAGIASGALMITGYILLMTSQGFKDIYQQSFNILNK